MTAEVRPVRPFSPPYSHHECPNDVDPYREDSENIYKRTALVALPFLSLCKPLSLPIAVGMGATRVYTSANKIVNDIESGDYTNISWDVMQTTIAVVALASTIFAHPIGMIVTTSQDILFELDRLMDSLEKGNIEASLISLTKIINNALYLALICHGGLELSIVSLAMQAITLVVSSRDEFKKGHTLEVCGNLLMAAVRLNQGYSQFTLLQRQWEIEEAIKHVVVGNLHEKWQFPSDHVPVGIEVDGVKIISWNVLNSAYMKWITTDDFQGLNGSMISDLDNVVRPDGLTQRDLVVVDMISSMMHSGQVIALQECGMPFLEALQEKLPSHWHMVKSFDTPRADQDVILFDTSKLAYLPDQSEAPKNAYPSVPGRPLQSVLFSRIGKEQGQNLRIVNAHIPGDPLLPAREEFAKYIRAMHRANQVTVGLGDNNFERDEMILAYEKAGFFDFSVHSPWKTNVDPYGKYSKAIDHFFVAGITGSRDLTPNEVLQGANLQETIALLNGSSIPNVQWSISQFFSQFFNQDTPPAAPAA